MLVPKLWTPPSAIGPVEMPAIAYLPNEGDTLFLATPVFIPRFGSVNSTPISVAGFRSFSFNGEVLDNNSVRSWWEVLDPRDHTRVVASYFLGDHIQQDVATPTDCGFYSGAGTAQGPTDAWSPPVIRLKFDTIFPGGANLNRVDGLWCYAT